MPLMPILYLQGKRIRKKIPRLPEAEGTSGYVNVGAVRNLSVLLIGESTMAGVGVKTHEDGFAGSFARKLASLSDSNVKWEVFARGGYTLKRLRYKIVPKIPNNKYDLIAIAMGGNDAFKLNSPKVFGENIKALIKACQQKFPATAIAFCNMPPIKEFPAFPAMVKFIVGNLVEFFGQKLKMICDQKSGVYYSSEVIRLDNWLQKIGTNNKQAKFFSDGVHPSQLTYEVWGEDFANFVAANIDLNH